LLVGAVLIPGARAPRLVTEEMVKNMQPGSVIVDVAIDQGGSIETIDRITTHSNPTYEKHGILHYAVANIPGAVARTSTLALSNVTVPYGLQIADKGVKRAALENRAIAKGLNTISGRITHKAVAESLGTSYSDVYRLLEDKLEIA
jgi:alanine dehydrogenase